MPKKKRPKLLSKTVGQLLDENAKKYPTKDAVVYVDQNYRLSWSELKDMVERTAKSFISLGVRKNDHIAVWGTNKPQWLFTQFAAAKIGATLVTMNPEWKAGELKFALKQSDSKVLVMIDGFEKRSGKKIHRYDYIEILQDACNLEEFPVLKDIIIISSHKIPKRIMPAWTPLSWTEFMNLDSETSNKTLKGMESSVGPDDICLIQYTSGTTGYPKGAMLTHYNVVNNALESSRNMELGHKDRLCGPVPYYHCFGSILVNICCLTVAATMVIPTEHFSARKTLEAIEREKCTALHGVPTMFTAQLADPEFSRFNPRTLRTGIMAGAPCPTELMKDVVNKMGAEKITIVYGLTEASPTTHQTRSNDSIERRVTTVGRPIDGTEAKIIDSKEFEKTGEVVEVGIGEVGEIWVKGPNIMKGYYKKPEETKKAIIGKWLRTGDLGTKDAQDYYKIVGRLKDMIIVGGHNVYPAEVEKDIYSLFNGDEDTDECDKYIELVQVVGVPHKTLQEVCAAVIKLRPGKKLTFEEIKTKCQDDMEWPKIPRYVKFVQDFGMAMTATGKIQKIKLREILIKELGLEKLAKRKTA